MLNEEHGDRARRWTIACVAAGVALVMVPFELVAGPIALRPTPFISVNHPADQTAQTQPANPAPAAPAAPARQVKRAQAPQGTADERQQIAKAIAARRAEMAKMDQSLATLRRETEALYVRQQQRLDPSRPTPQAQGLPVNDPQLRAEFEGRLRQALELRGVEQQSTQQFLADQLQEVLAAQRSLDLQLEELKAKIEAVRAQAETTK